MQEPVNKNEGWQTAISRKNMEAPLREIPIKGKVLDYGCGRGQTADREGWEKYDPNWFPQVVFTNYDTILCTYVANVITKEDDRHALYKSLMMVSGGRATIYLTVRRNIKNTKTQIDIPEEEILSLGYKSFLKKRDYEIYVIGRK